MIFELNEIMKASAFKQAIEDAFAKSFDISSEGNNTIESNNEFKGNSVFKGDITVETPINEVDGEDVVGQKPTINLVDSVVKVDTPENNYNLSDEENVSKAVNVRFVYLQPTILAGTVNPQTALGASLGKNGDIYVMYQNDEV